MSEPARFAIALVFVLLLSGCVTTPVSFPEPGPELKKLSELQLQPVTLTIDAPQSITVGRQYLLLVIPFGEVILDKFHNDLLNSASEALLLSGFKPIVVKSRPIAENQAIPHIVLTHQTTSINAFDLFALRRISVAIKIRLQRYNRTGLLVEDTVLSAATSGYKRFAFSKQLDFYYQQALRKLFANQFK